MIGIQTDFHPSLFFGFVLPSPLQYYLNNINMKSTNFVVALAALTTDSKTLEISSALKIH